MCSSSNYSTNQFGTTLPLQDDEQPDSRAGLARAVVLRYGHLLRKHWASFQRDVSDFNVLQVRPLCLLLGALCCTYLIVPLVCWGTVPHQLLG